MGWRGLRDDGEGAACVGGQHEPGRVCGQGPVLPGVAGVRWLDMQGRRVVSWLSQHNFPQGMIFFSDGLVHDPLRQKAIFLRNLVQEVSFWP